MQVVEHNTFERWPLEDGSVQAVITSPPYWQIRVYDIPDVIIGGDLNCRHDFVMKAHKDGRGTKGMKLEGADYTEPNRLNYAEGTCRRCGAWKGQHGLEPTYQLYLEHTLLWIKEVKRVLKKDGLFIMNMGDKYLNGSKLKLPDRIAISLIDDGWKNRNDIVWFKKNGIPGSMKSRFISRHENINIFSKSRKYFYDIDSVRVPYAEDSARRMGGYNKSGVPAHASPDGKSIVCKNYKPHPLGANPGDVWVFSAAKNGKGKHFATYPEALVERMIKFSTRQGDTVLDPFCGTGTTLKVASSLGRKSVGFDLGYHEVLGDLVKKEEERLSA